MISKFCHNEKCQYVTQSDPEIDVWAHTDVPCPNCDELESLKAEVPEFLIKRLIKEWWRTHHAIK